MQIALAALVSWLLVGVFIKLARRYRLGQKVRSDGPESHLAKDGTPTMGGLPFSLAIFGLWLAITKSDNNSWAVFWMSLGMCAVGLIDDLMLMIRTSRGLPRVGLRAREKIALQIIIGLIFAIVVARTVQTFGIPFLDVIFYTFVVAGSVNAVNFADGLDGLAAGVVAIALIPLAITQPLATITIGSLLGYLWFNFRPASIFMGDAGSHALGGLLAGLYIINGSVWVLPLAGIYPVLAILSVVIQVVYFRRTGKRVFKMAPLHHHFELSGWGEVKTVGRLWILTAVATAIAWALMK